MAVTRHATGSSRPRQFTVVSTEPTTKRKTTTKTKTTTKGAATKPRAKKTTTGRVTKNAGGTTTGTKHRRKPTIGDKVKGAAKKLEGTIERKPGKKAAGTSEMRGHDGKKKRKSTGTKAAAKKEEEKIVA